jgi:hypothetical protein
VTQAESLREPSTSLTDDSEVMENPNLDKFVVVESLPASYGVLFDLLY